MYASAQTTLCRESLCLDEHLRRKIDTDYLLRALWQIQRIICLPITRVDSSRSCLCLQRSPCFSRLAIRLYNVRLIHTDTCKFETSRMIQATQEPKGLPKGRGGSHIGDLVRSCPCQAALRISAGRQRWCPMLTALGQVCPWPPCCAASVPRPQANLQQCVVQNQGARGTGSRFR